MSGTGGLLASSDPKGVSFFYEPLAKFQPLIIEAFDGIVNFTRSEFEQVYESEYINLNGGAINYFCIHFRVFSHVLWSFGRKFSQGWEKAHNTEDYPTALESLEALGGEHELQGAAYFALIVMLQHMFHSLKHDRFFTWCETPERYSLRWWREVCSTGRPNTPSSSVTSCWMIWGWRPCWIAQGWLGCCIF